MLEKVSTEIPKISVLHTSNFIPDLKPGFQKFETKPFSFSLELKCRVKMEID
jgi:hypothetical protein